MNVFKLLPVGKDYLWGGNKLNTDYGKGIEMNPLAETWECSVHPDGESIVATGEYKGKTLREVLLLHPEYMGSKFSDNMEFPILVKFIDAKKDLSVQVHPNDEYARKYENQNGKTEMWYVLDADEDANLILGFEHNMSVDILRESIQEGSLDKHLHKVKIKKGDCVYVPAGTVHGIGAGTLIAEIQESSNVTYRVYDYNRVDKNGRKRELHFEKACQVMNMKAEGDDKHTSKYIQYYQGCSIEKLCRCQYFDVDRIRLVDGIEMKAQEQSFQVLLFIKGTGMLKSEGDAIFEVQKGDCVFLTAGDEKLTIEGRIEFLRVGC